MTPHYSDTKMNKRDIIDEMRAYRQESIEMGLELTPEQESTLYKKLVIESEQDIPAEERTYSFTGLGLRRK